MVTKPRQKCKNIISKSFFFKNKVVSLIKLQQFSKHLRLRETTPSRRGKIHSFQKNLFKYPRLLSWASGQEIPFVRDSLLIEEEACANNLQYKVAWHLRKAKTLYLLNVKTTKMASQDYF